MKFLKKLDPRLHLALLMFGLFCGAILAGMSVRAASAVTASGLGLSLVLGYVRWRAAVLRERAWLAQAEGTLPEFEAALAGFPPGNPRHAALAERLDRTRKELDAARQRLYRRQPYLPDFLQV